MLEEAFPELRESEDERALRIIKKRMCYDPVPISDEDRRIVENWLEKQKEQKEIPLMNGDADLYFDNWIQHNDTTKRGYFEEGIRYAQRLQKEQEPAECIPDSVKFDEGFKTGREVGFREGVESAKPAEWSEEDSIMLDSILAVIEEWESNQSEKEKEYYGATPKADWLKSLRPQPKQEWSEEDERILKGIIGKIDHDQTYGVSKAEMLSLLEGLRPSWKPSEEQMSSLKQARDYYMSGRIKYVGQHLSEIAEQLEKL